MHAPSPLVARVRQFWQALAEVPGPVVVAVSGGPDSVALLRALLAVPAGPLVIAHLNHRLRGEESDADEAFVRELYSRLAATEPTGLKLACSSHDVAASARAEGDNLEQVARRVRYNWLAEVAREHQAGRVATGHTADDQAETVLHRLLRGAGLRGLAGIPPRRPLAPGVEVVRPLLEVTRAEVLAYLHDEGQAFREDRSNRDLRLTRNRIRHELLPYLAERYNPAVSGLLGRLAGQAREVFRLIEDLARELLVEAELPRAGTALVFDRRRLESAPRHLVREMFRLAWEREAWPLGGMGFAEWDRLAAVARGEAVAADLPGRIHVQCRERVVLVGER